jgi:hypothetical protein
MPYLMARQPPSGDWVYFIDTKLVSLCSPVVLPENEPPIVGNWTTAKTASRFTIGHMMGITAVIKDRQTLFGTLLEGSPRETNELLIGGRRMKAVVV